jgi:hypothetical protein
LWLRATNSFSAPGVLESVEHLVDGRDTSGQDRPGDVRDDVAHRLSTSALGILALALVEDESTHVDIAWLDQAQLECGHAHPAVDLRNRLAAVVERLDRGQNPAVIPWSERDHGSIVAIAARIVCANFETNLCPKKR